MTGRCLAEDGSGRRTRPEGLDVTSTGEGLGPIDKNREGAPVGSGRGLAGPFPTRKDGTRRVCRGMGRRMERIRRPWVGGPCGAREKRGLAGWVRMLRAAGRGDGGGGGGGAGGGPGGGDQILMLCFSCTSMLRGISLPLTEPHHPTPHPPSP